MKAGVGMDARRTAEQGQAAGRMPGSSSVPGGGVRSLNDRYRIEARVGLGGTAVVYRCVDLHTQRIVAVKVLRTTGRMIPEAEARFRREARLAASLTHPHIVRVLDFGYTQQPETPAHVPWQDDTDGPVPYLAMEYVFGSTLKELVRRRGPLPIDWVWRIGEQLCSALGAAHALGVVHRDVKPQNVMVLDSRLELLAKLADFGIARQVGGDLTTLTTTGEILGTPDYLSPEQVLGEPGGPSSDLFALGIVLYELLTARLPFEADSPLAAATRRMVADPVPLSAYRSDIPWPLQEVVLVALRREPGERYRNASEMVEALHWSRGQSPGVALGERGRWVLGPRSRRPTEPLDEQLYASGAPPAAGAPPAQGAAAPVLRVAPPSIPVADALSAGQHSPLAPEGASAADVFLPSSSAPPDREAHGARDPALS
jgi:serine/threonine-protein kinase